MTEDRLSKKEVLDQLGLSEDELEELIGSGDLNPVEENGEQFFSRDEVNTLAEGESAPGRGDEPATEEEEEGEPELLEFDEGLELELEEGTEPTPDTSEETKGEDEEETTLEDEDEDDLLLLLDEEEEAEGPAEEQEESKEPETLDEEETALVEDEDDLLLLLDEEDESEQGPDDESAASEGEGLDEEDMITEMVDVTALEEDEEDLLDEVVEDSGEDLTMEELAPPQKKSEPAAGLEEDTELDETFEDIEEFGEEEYEDFPEETAEGLEDEELEGILAEEETEGEEEEWDVSYATPKSSAELTFPKWAIALLVATFIIQVICALYIVENSLPPEYSTGITDALNITRFF